MELFLDSVSIQNEETEELPVESRVRLTYLVDDYINLTWDIQYYYLILLSFLLDICIIWKHLFDDVL